MKKSIHLSDLDVKDVILQNCCNTNIYGVGVHKCYIPELIHFSGEYSLKPNNYNNKERSNESAFFLFGYDFDKVSFIEYLFDHNISFLLSSSKPFYIIFVDENKYIATETNEDFNEFELIDINLKRLISII